MNSARALWVLCIVFVATPLTYGEGDGESGKGRPQNVVPSRRVQESDTKVKWVRSLRNGHDRSIQENKPLFVAMHESAGRDNDTWPSSLAGWAALYDDARIQRALQSFVCVQQIRSNVLLRGGTDDESEGAASRDAKDGSPVLMVLERGERALAIREHWTAARGEASVVALLKFLTDARARFQPALEGSPRPVDVPKPLQRGKQAVAGSVMNPTPLSIKHPAIRIHLRWGLPAPRFSDRASSKAAGEQSWQSGVVMTWDDQGPFVLKPLTVTPGKHLDHAVDIRLKTIEGLEPYLTKGKHALTLYLRTLQGQPSLGDNAVPVARVWINLGEGGGGGGGGGDANAPKPNDEKEDKNEADKPEEGEENETPPPVEPKENRQEVVEPFVRNNDTIEKDDALVAVEDDQAGLEEPPPEINEQRLRQFEAQVADALRDERISADEAAYLRRYFEALRKRSRTRRKTKPSGRGR